jgi:hypothetical protein
VISDRLKLLLLLLLALLQGILYIVIVPPWQHYDEPTHFEYAWLIANKGILPEAADIDPLMRREVLASMTRHDFFVGPPPQWLNDAGQVWLGILELTHPPAYYAYLALGLSPFSFLDMTSQLYIARFMTVLLYLGTVGFMYAITAELTPRRHMLRWLVPLTVVLIGPFANQMTAVNNDAASAFSLTLFLWMAVRLVRRNFSVGALLLLSFTALLAVFSKNTTALAVALMPHVLILVWWLRRRWAWHWFWLSAGLLGAVFIFVFFEWGDAAYWYRFENQSVQLYPTQSEAPLETAYPYSVRITVDSKDPERKLLNPLFAHQMKDIAGKAVSVGGWIWSNETQAIDAPGLLLSNRNSNQLYSLTEPITVTTTPTFVVATYTIPEEAAVGYYSLFAKTVLAKEAYFDVYLQGAFLIEGGWPENVAPPSLGAPLPATIEGRNLLRNGTPTEGWPRLRTWVDQVFERYFRRSPSYLFSALLDVQRNVPFLLGSIAPYLLTDLFVAYGWGQVRIGEWWWIYGFSLLVVMAFIGLWRWYQRSKSKRSNSLLPAISVLAVAGIMVWIAALIWPLPYNWARLTLPSARYTFAAIAPTALFLAGGWWAVWSERWRTLGIAIFVILLVFLNLAGIWRIIEFYHM